MVNVNLLKNTIKEQGIRNLFIADKMGLSPEGFYKKLRGESEFKVSEVSCLTEVLRLTEEQRNAIFFAEEVE